MSAFALHMRGLGKSMVVLSLFEKLDTLMKDQLNLRVFTKNSSI